MLMEAAPPGSTSRAGRAICAVRGRPRGPRAPRLDRHRRFGALAAHVVVAARRGPRPRRRRLEVLLRERYGIDHTTLQMEEEAGEGCSQVREPRLLRPGRRANAVASAMQRSFRRRGLLASLTARRAGRWPDAIRNRALTAIAPAALARSPLRGAARRCSLPAPPRRRRTCSRSSTQAGPARPGRSTRGRAVHDDRALRDQIAGSSGRWRRSATARPGAAELDAKQAELDQARRAATAPRRSSRRARAPAARDRRPEGAARRDL